MRPCHPKEDVVVRLLDGRSDLRELVLEGGQPRPPFTIGSRSEWRVDAGHVAPAHVMLAYNGIVLYVRAVPGEMALLDGAPLDARWVVAAMPCELRFGSARVVIGQRSAADEMDEMGEGTLSPAALSVPPPRAEVVTCADEERLQSALRLSAASCEETSSTEVAPPIAERKPRLVTLPLPSLRRPAIRALR